MSMGREEKRSRRRNQTDEIFLPQEGKLEVSF